MNSQDFQYFNGVGASGASKFPVQSVPNSKKNEDWKRNTMQFLYTTAKKQQKKNIVFSDIRNMSKGEFTYRAVDVERTYDDNPWVEQQFNNLGNKVGISTYLKHFDIIGIIVNAITSVFGTMPDLYRVDSIDEYSTNEFIRQKTEGLKKYRDAIFKREIDAMLIVEGMNPDKQDFKSQEEADQYMAQLDAKVKEYSPQEIERNLAKNFKVLATEWATNKLKSDKEIFDLEKKDKDALTDYILTGRWFRHYRVGYDTYTVESWSPEEVFFSQEVDTEYPQDGNYIGKLTSMSPNSVLQKYGHLMDTKQQEIIGNYWNQDTTFKGASNIGSSGAQAYQVPFRNYFNHQINMQMEDALGVPLARTMDLDGNVSGRHYMPREDGVFGQQSTVNYSRQLRKDIDVDSDQIEVMEVYWLSMKRIGVLVYKDDMGNPMVEITTDDLLKDILIEDEIKKLKNVSLEELQKALRIEKIEDYIGTISYHYVPEAWQGILIKANHSKLKEDMHLGVKPLDYQIRGDSNWFQVRLPVGGIISTGLMPKVLPYQQLYNVCMNQVTELLAKEQRLGVFFTIDINSLPSEYKDETTAEAIEAVGDVIQNTGILPLDPSRANTAGSAVYPNLFQKNDVTFANQIQYRQQLAEYYKQLAYNQVGITAQMLGAPQMYTTAEGVKQGAVASYALMQGMIQDFNVAKKKSNELHLAVAQFCETNGKSTSKLTRQPDHLLRFLDILAEDEELFQFRKLSIIPASNTQDTKIVQAIQNMLMNDNTITKDMGDIIDVLTNPYVLELREIGLAQRARQDAKAQQEQQFQKQQQDAALQARAEEVKGIREFEEKIVRIKGEYGLEEAYLTAAGRDSASTKEDNFGDLEKARELVQDSMKNSFTQKGLELKEQDHERKVLMDSEQRKAEMEKIKLKRDEITLKNKKMQSDERIALWNKN